MSANHVIVAVQISCMLFIAVTGRVIPASPVMLIIAALFLLFALWAVVEMKFRFNIFPELLKDSSLVTSGPYRFVRHPMYSAFIVITIIWILDDYSLVRFIVWSVLVIVLSYKMNLEEQIIARKFPEYKQYRAKTKRIIPYLY